MSPRPLDGVSSEAATEPLPVIAISEYQPDAQEHTPHRVRTIARYTLSSALGISIGTGVGMGVITAIPNAPEFIAYQVAAGDDSGYNDEMSDIASEIIGRSLRVDCNNDRLSASGEAIESEESYRTLGEVATFRLPLLKPISYPLMTLREEICETVVNYTPTNLFESENVGDDYYAMLDFADSIAVVLHEGHHIQRVHNEAAATCYAYQELPRALAELGIQQALADMIARDSSFSLGARLMDEYYSEECREGGELDLGVGDLYVQTPLRVSQPVIP